MSTASARLGRVRAADGLPQALGSAECARMGTASARLGRVRADGPDEGPAPRQRTSSFSRPSTDAIGMGCTPSASASPVPRLATIGSSISSASSQVTNVGPDRASQGAQHGTGDRQRHVQQAPAAPIERSATRTMSS